MPYEIHLRLEHEKASGKVNASAIVFPKKFDTLKEIKSYIKKHIDETRLKLEVVDTETKEVVRSVVLIGAE